MFWNVFFWSCRLICFFVGLGNRSSLGVLFRIEVDMGGVLLIMIILWVVVLVYFLVVVVVSFMV